MEETCSTVEQGLFVMWTQKQLTEMLQLTQLGCTELYSCTGFGVEHPTLSFPVEEKLLFWKQTHERTGDHGNRTQEAGYMVHGHSATELRNHAALVLFTPIKHKHTFNLKVSQTHLITFYFLRSADETQCWFKCKHVEYCIAHDIIINITLYIFIKTRLQMSSQRCNIMLYFYVICIFLVYGLNKDLFKKEFNLSQYI